MGNEYQRFLMHHGVKGQEWGVRNGPPYPLKPNQRSASERKAADGATGSAALAAVAIPALMITPMIANATRNAIKVYRENKKVEKIVDDAEKYSNDKKYASERENEEIDPETGLYLTGKKMTEEENMERINPSYDSGNEMFKINCTACTMAMELRERGYDVHAGTDSSKMYKYGGVTDTERGDEWFDNDNYFTKNTKYYIDTPSENIKAFKSDISKEPNSRGEICVKWNGWGGHSMYYKTDDKGKLTIYDTQSNKKLTDKEAQDILEGSDWMQYTRLDTATPNIQYLKDNNYIR